MRSLPTKFLKALSITASRGFVLIALTIPLSVVGAAEMSWRVPSDDQIRNILRERIDERGESIGIVVGIITPDRRSVVSYGTFGKDDPRPVDGDTIFEIGSINKVFTTLLLSDLAQHGQLSLDDPAGGCLPPGSTMPERGGKQITYTDLATHTSGLPLYPTNLDRSDPATANADYSPEKLYEFLSTYKMQRDIGADYEYSSFGMALLGHMLGLCAGIDPADLIQERILTPLGLNDTVFNVPPELLPRLVTGHNAALEPVVGTPNTATLGGAGAQRSSANDMLKFLEAVMGVTDSPLKPAMDAQLDIRRPTGIPDVEIGIGWHIQKVGSLGDLVSHGGTTGGFRAFTGFVPSTGVGVIALSNTSTETGVDDIGYHVLAGAALSQPPERSLDAAVLQRYVGNYELTPSMTVTISREDSRLYLQLTDRPRMELLAQSETKFFFKDTPDQVSFDVEGEEQASALTVHTGGDELPAKRMK